VGENGCAGAGPSTPDAPGMIGRRNLSTIVADPVADPVAGPFRTEGALARLLDQARCPAVSVRGPEGAS
jgi:hypothetical protein